MTSATKRARLVAAWVAGAYLGWMYVEMGWVKFDPDGFWRPAFERWGTLRGCACWWESSRRLAEQCSSFPGMRRTELLDSPLS